VTHDRETRVVPVDREPDAVEQTTRIPVITRAVTEFFNPLTGDLDIQEPTAHTKRRRRLQRLLIVSGVAAGALAVLYGADVLLSRGTVPRGTVVADVEIGGLSRTSAEAKLRAVIEPRVSAPVKIMAADVTTTLDARRAGLTPDWSGTLDRVGDQSLNPFTRIASFFFQREVPFATTVDDAKLVAQLEMLRGKVNRDPIEGSVRFEGLTPVAVQPKQGQKVNETGASRSIVDNWMRGSVVTVPVDSVEVKVTPDGVRDAIDKFAKPAVSGPVLVKGEGKQATLSQQVIASALSFTPGDRGSLAPKIDQVKVVDVLEPQLASTEQQGNDAQMLFDDGTPVVKPSTDGRGIDWNKSLGDLVDVLRHSDNRVINAQYSAQPAKVTTEQAKSLNIKEVIGEFTTRGFAADSGVNIRKVAEKVGGAIVKPNEVFSLNGYTGPRGARQGYVEAGVIENGAPAREVGGGISQFATTLYNASYFAGLMDAGHQEHSYYISRYPAAREATVFQNPDGTSVIDLKFKNDSPSGIAIQTIWTPSSITVKLWGTKRYTVESISGEKTDFVQPQPRKGPERDCHPSEGGPGFVTTDTRVIKDAATGREVSRHTRRVHYDPSPKIICGDVTH